MTFIIDTVNAQFDEEIKAKIDGKTKPIGALGQ